MLEAGPDRYVRPDVGRGERVQVEFVSANPTGPLHVGNGWFASFGDAPRVVCYSVAATSSSASTT